MNSIRIKAKNIGPIAESDIVLRPLTIFVGQNNTGKSYLAQLVYAISQALERLFRTYKPYEPFLEFEYPSIMLGEEITWDKQTLHAYQQLLPPLDELIKRPSRYKRRLRIPVGSLPQKIYEQLDNYLGVILNQFDAYLGSEIQRCYDTKLNKLVSKVGDGGNLSIDIESKEPNLRLHYELAGNKLKRTGVEYSLKDQNIDVMLPPAYYYSPHLFPQRKADFKSFRESFLSTVAWATINNGAFQILDIMPRGSFYMPAARSGILQGQKALARVGLRALGHAGLEPISITKLPGVFIDFLDSIYSIDRDERGDFYQLAKKIERELTPGRIEFVEHKPELPEIFFREPGVGRLALHKTSSMVSELAPVILALRYLVEKNDLIIIEEPESHAHPGAQRYIAKFIVWLARRGVNILLTTHSDYLLQQISNLVALYSKPDLQKERLGYSVMDSISPDEVGAYMFIRASNTVGSIVKSLDVGGEGISNDEFAVVAENLYRETIEAKREISRGQSSESQA